MQLRSGRRSARLQRMIRSQVRRAFHGYCRKRTCKKTVMSGRIKAGFVILLNFRRRLIAFVAFRRCRFWCEIGAVRHSSLAGQRIHHASRTVGSNPSLSASLLKLRILRVNSPANKPSNSSDFSFELRTPDRQSWPVVLRKARFSPKLWTPSIRYGSRNSNVWSDLRTSSERGFAASLGQGGASDF